MEQLGKAILYIGVAGLVVTVIGLWLLHTAVNDGEIWKGVVAVILVVVGGLCSLPLVASAGGRQ